MTVTFTLCMHFFPYWPFKGQLAALAAIHPLWGNPYAWSGIHLSLSINADDGRCPSQVALNFVVKGELSIVGDSITFT